MKRIHCYYRLVLFAAVLYILAWEFAAFMAFAQSEVVHQQGKGQILQFPQPALDTIQAPQSMEKVQLGNEKAVKWLSRLGSRPPNCEHKCRDCRPCIAVQVPKTADHFRLQYANYEPEGWACKCGSSFFVP